MTREILPYPPVGSKGIVYARRSAPGERDQDESISFQVERRQAWLRERGYEILPAIEDYADGDSWNFYRDKLQELLRRARKQEFQIVVVAAKDRLSRKAEHRPVIRFFLHEASVKLHSLRPQEEERDEPFAGLIEAIEDEQDEQERIKIRERLNNGKLYRVQQQKLMACSFPLYGYRWADLDVARGKSRYVENPETAPAVRLAFRLATEGKTLEEICTALTLAGYPPPLYYRFLCGKLPRNRTARKAWTHPSVYTISGCLGGSHPYIRTTRDFTPAICNLAGRA